MDTRLTLDGICRMWFRLSDSLRRDDRYALNVGHDAEDEWAKRVIVVDVGDD